MFMTDFEYLEIFAVFISYRVVNFMRIDTFEIAGVKWYFFTKPGRPVAIACISLSLNANTSYSK